MRCPACHEHELAGEGDDYPVGTCPGCLGRWVPSSRLLRIEDELHRVRPADLGPADPHFRCPACGSPFAELEVAGTEINVCTRCGGRWFDVGEEEAVTAQPDPAPYGDPD